VASKIKVLSFGRSRKDLFDVEIERFIKMSRPWSTVEFKTLKPVENRNESVESALTKESVLLQKQWSENSITISLGEEGKLMSSEQFAKFIKTASENGKDLIFNIGSAYGLSKKVKSESTMVMSLSPMTMPYKLCRLFFAEQIYRALAINHNHPYHKE